jgi:hypothetical protein
MFGQTPQETGVFSGVLVDAVTGQPLAEASVRLEPGSSSVVLTDELGRFEFHVASNALQVLFAEKPRYLPLTLPGKTFSISPGIPVWLASGEGHQEAEFALVPSGSISGRVVDSLGQGVQGVAVRLFRDWYHADGRLGPRWLESKLSDSRGQFSFNDMGPGDYGVRIEPDRAGIGDRTTTHFLPFYYPLASQTENAQMVRVVAGANTRLDEIALPSQTIATLRLKAFDGSTSSQQPVQVFVQPSDESGHSRSVRWGWLPPEGGVVGTLAQGSYDVSVEVATNEGRFFAHQSLSISEDTNATLQLPPSARVDGRVVRNDAITGSTPVSGIRFRLYDLRLSPDSYSDDGSFFNWNNRESTIVYSSSTDSLGTTSIPRLMPGTYRLALDPVPPGEYVSAIWAGGVDALTNSIRIEGGQEIEVEAHLAPAYGVSGVVTDGSGKSVPRAIVALLAAGPREGAQSQWAGISDWDGQFALDVAPGSYYVFAWTDLPGAAYRNATFMNEFDGLGTPIQVVAGGLSGLRVEVLAWPD